MYKVNEVLASPCHALPSYDDTVSEDNQMNSESKDEIIEDMEQVAAEMKNHVELNKTVEDKKSNQ